MIRAFFRDFVNEISGYYDGMVAISPKLLFSIIIIAASWFITRSIRHLTDKKLKKQLEDPLLAEFLSNLIRSVLFIIGLLFAFKVLGLGGVTASILAGAGITAFIIGFALRDIGENFLAGILMAFKRPFRVGDFVETGPVKGRVVALSLRDTHIKAPDGRDVFVPNANIIKNPLFNYTVDGFLRFDFVVNLPSNNDYDAIMNRIREVVDQVEGVLRRRRKTSVFVSGIAPGRVDITVSFWIDNFKIRTSAESVRSQVILKVQQLLEDIEKQSSRSTWG